MNTDEQGALIKGIKEALATQNAEVVNAITKHDEDLKVFGKVQEGTKEAIAALNTQGGELSARLLTLEQSIAEGSRNRDPRHEKSMGERFAESEEMAEFRQRGAKGTCRPLQVKSITSLTGSAGVGIWSQRLPGVVEPPLRPLTIRDLLDQGTTDSNLIEWIKELVYTNSADVVSEGAQKPESDITYERADVPVRTIAHWIHATRQVLSDFKQLATLINGRLTYGLKIAEEDQLLLGDGTGENILGLIPQATAYSNSLDVASDTKIDVIRHAILQVRQAFYPSSGVVLNPRDWHDIELTKDNENRYLMASPQGRIPPMLWGLPVVEADAISVDEFLVGAFRMAATVFDREQAQIMVSTEDRDNFVKNMVTILCEERLALAVSRPAAVVPVGLPARSTN